MKEFFLETPETSFEKVINFSYKVNYMNSMLGLPENYESFKIAYYDENQSGKSGVILFIHGHPTWSFMWRHLILYGLKHDYRVISVDLPGFGRSDKPLKKEFFDFEIYRNIILNLIKNLNLNNITLFLHEWGGTLGLTLPMDNPANFKDLVLFNSYLGNSLSNVSDDYQNWIKSNISNDSLNVRALMARTNRILNLSECNAYEAPFSTKNSKLSLQMLPSVFPMRDGMGGFKICAKALEWWKENSLRKVLVIGGGRDPLIPIEKMKAISRIISTDEQTHIISNAGHFVPEWGMEFGDELFLQLTDE